jgi:hypothetical protein
MVAASFCEPFRTVGLLARTRRQQRTTPTSLDSLVCLNYFRRDLTSRSKLWATGDPGLAVSSF